MRDIVELPILPQGEPDSEFVYRDFRANRVDTMFLFTGSYEFEGDRWEVELWATDLDQAQRKLAAMGGGTIDGQVFAKVEA